MRHVKLSVLTVNERGNYNVRVVWESPNPTTVRQWIDYLRTAGGLLDDDIFIVEHVTGSVPAALVLPTTAPAAARPWTLRALVYQEDEIVDIFEHALPLSTLLRLAKREIVRAKRIPPGTRIRIQVENQLHEERQVLHNKEWVVPLTYRGTA